MEHDSSRSGYHQLQPESAGHNVHNFADDADMEWDSDDIEASTHQLKPYVNLIWAQGFAPDGTPGAIGKDGSMLWRLSEDMKYFKDRTITHPVIMGRKTWESLSEQYRPLSNRDNYVISRNPNFTAAGATVMDSLEDAIELASQPTIPDDGVRRDEVWIIGGAQIYNAALPFTDAIYITDVDIHIDADTFVPDMSREIAAGRWSEEIIQDWTTPRNSTNDISRFRFRVLRRVQ
ncbi:dihydrofolate reductase [Alloscardovia venturai]|uniref:dihydrofolate reductase n=1 Tax=Alloscardovia venturai TaxID=1769421 RepID=A0ABW2Y9G7_9BIFI